MYSAQPSLLSNSEHFSSPQNENAHQILAATPLNFPLLNLVSSVSGACLFLIFHVRRLIICGLLFGASFIEYCR